MSTPSARINPSVSDTPRARRGVAGVIAQYIQDLSQSPGLNPAARGAAA